MLMEHAEGTTEGKTEITFLNNLNLEAQSVLQSQNSLKSVKSLFQKNQGNNSLRMGQ